MKRYDKTITKITKTEFLLFDDNEYERITEIEGNDIYIYWVGELNLERFGVKQDHRDEFLEEIYTKFLREEKLKRIVNVKKM